MKRVLRENRPRSSAFAVRPADAIIVETPSGLAVALFDPDTGELLSSGRFAPDAALTDRERELVERMAVAMRAIP